MDKCLDWANWGAPAPGQMEVLGRDMCLDYVSWGFQAEEQMDIVDK